jgi:hypothetical protein
MLSTNTTDEERQMSEEKKIPEGMTPEQVKAQLEEHRMKYPWLWEDLVSDEELKIHEQQELSRDAALVKDDLIEKAKRKPVTRVLTIDGQLQRGADSFFTPDSDGHVIHSTINLELRNIAGSPTMPVRAEVCPDSDPATVAAMLRKMADYVEESWEQMRPQGQTTADHVHHRAAEIRRIEAAAPVGERPDDCPF